MRSYFAGEGSRIEYLKTLKGLGVVYDTPYANEMAKLLEDSEFEERFMQGKLGGMKKYMDTATKFYQWGDDFWKIMGFENEVSLLEKHYGLDRGTMENPGPAMIKAAERIRNTYPTYSMVGTFIQKLRRFPLAGTFVSFPAEIIRTTFNILKYAKEDMQHSRTLGMRRLSGIAISGGFAYALQEFMKQAVGVDDDEEEAIRELSPKWSKNSNILFMGREEGKVRYMDLSFLDPYNYWKRPITAIMRDEPVRDKAVEVAREILTPFFGQDIAFGALVDIWMNQKDSGGRVYNPADTGGQQSYDIGNHIWRQLRPGAAMNAERMWLAATGEKSKSGRQYTVGDESAALVGFRITTLDPKISLFYRSYEFNDKIRNASSILNAVARNPNKVSESEMMGAFERASEVRSEAFVDMIGLASAARKNGLNDLQMIKLLRGAGISKKNSAAIVRGNVPRWRPTNAFMRSAIKRAEVIFDAETTEEFKKRRNLVLKRVGE